MNAARYRIRIVSGLLLSVFAFADLHVATTGTDEGSGTAEKPFKTLERARDEIRKSKRRTGILPLEGFQVVIHAGEYPVRNAFQLTDEDSGTATAPIVYRAADGEAPRFTGGARLGRPMVLDDAEVLASLPESARGLVVEWNLADAGIGALIPFDLGGFSSGKGFKTYPAVELFVDGEPMTLARWPNEGFARTGDPTGPLTLESWDKRAGSVEGQFVFASDRLAQWAKEPDGWLYGYWYWTWADSYERIESINLEKQIISLAKPWHGYGYRKDQPFFAVNMLCELDAPGEWYADRARGKIFLYPKADLANATVELSLTATPLLDIAGASHVTFRGLTWECGAADGIRIQGGDNISLEGCTIRKCGGNGIELADGRGHIIQSCDIHTLGRGGIVMDGGDRKSLVAGDHLIENCHIHHLSRIDHTYTPGIWMDGVGNRVRHNQFHDIASSAMRIEGNDHLIELNEVFRVVLESDDQGAVDMFGNPTYRGNVYRHNYWHHLGKPKRDDEHERPQQAGIRLDDAICGVVIQGNVFQRIGATPTHFGGVQIHGGKENIIEGNLFVECGAAVSFTPWGEKRWQEFVATRLDDPAIDRERYLAKYPDLAKLSEGHDKNQVKGNAVLRCDTMFLRGHERVESTGNQESADATLFKEGPDGRLVWSASDADKLGVSSIPFDRIGLYADAFRKK